MSTVRAVVQNGRIELEHPLDLPNGTPLLIPLPDASQSLGMPDDDRPESREEIEAWLRWYDSFEPVEFKPEELAAWNAARAEDKQRELAQWDERSKRIEPLFQ